MSLSARGCLLAASIVTLIAASTAEADEPYGVQPSSVVGVPLRSPVVLRSGIVRNPYIGVPPSRPFYGVRPSTPYSYYSPGYARQRSYGANRTPLPSRRLYSTQGPYGYRDALYGNAYRSNRSYANPPSRGRLPYRASGRLWTR